MLAPGAPIKPLPEAEAAALFASSAAGQAKRTRGAQRLKTSTLTCPVVQQGWVWLLSPGAAAVHTLLCGPPVTSTGVRGGQRVEQLVERLLGRGTIVGLSQDDEVLGELAAHATTVQLRALTQLQDAAHEPMSPEHVTLILTQLETLGLAVTDGGRWWCASSPLAPPPGAAAELPMVPVSQPWRHAAALAAEALAMCWLRRTDRYSLPIWDLLNNDGPDAWRRDALFSGDPDTGEHYLPLIENATGTGLRVNALAAPLVILKPSELPVELGEDIGGADSSDVPRSVELSLTFQVQFARGVSAGIVGDIERNALAATGVATCDAATPARQMLPAVLALMPHGWRTQIAGHARRLDGRGALGRGLAQRSLAEFAADAGVPVHSDRRAAAALALRSEPVGYTSAGSVLHNCSSGRSHVSPFGIAEVQDDNSDEARSWFALERAVVSGGDELGSSAGMTAKNQANPLGLPQAAATSELPPESPRRLPLALLRFARTWTALNYDRAVLDAGGRWPDRLAPMPSTMPGDAVALRAFGVEQQIARWDCWSEEMNASTAFDGREPMADQAFDMHLSAAVLAQAVPFFLPSNVSAGVAGSVPPNEDVLTDLHLPHPVCLIALGAPILLEPRSGHWPAHLLPDLAAWNDAVKDEDDSLSRLREHDRPQPGEAVLTARGGDGAASSAGANPSRSPVLRRGRTASCADVVSVTRMPLLAALWRFGALIDGVVLLSSEDGGVRDECLWLVRVPHPHDATRSIGRAVLHGQVRTSAFRDPVANLATALAVSEWHVPTGAAGSAALPLDPSDPAFRKAARKATFPEHEAAGAAGGVRVLTLPTAPADDAHDMLPRTPVETSEEERRRLRTHLRRGHWKRVRFGPRDDWAYRNVLILPTVVNASDQSWRGVAVYRLPEPDHS